MAECPNRDHHTGHCSRGCKGFQCRWREERRAEAEAAQREAALRTMPPMRHLLKATDEERKDLAKELLRLQLRDGNNTRNMFLYETAMAVHREETIRLCTR